MWGLSNSHKEEKSIKDVMCNRLFSLKETFPQCWLKNFLGYGMKKKLYLFFIKTEVNKVFWDHTSEDISSKKL